MALLLLTTMGYSQSTERQVIGSSGAILTDGAIASIEFTVGELVVSKITDGTTALTQGFHQPLVQIKISALVLLQGAAINPNTLEETLMRDDLRVGGYLPTTSPYADGLICNASVLSVIGKNAIVDWVWVELRDESDYNTIVSSQSALLQRDGDIVGIDGVSSLNFSVGVKSYYVSIQHRNHLGILSANAIALSETVSILDFLTTSSTVLGAVNGVTDLGDGRFAIYGGDYDGNGQVQNSDVTGVVFLLGNSGYDGSDSDMNGQIQNTDINNLINPNLGKGEQF